MNLNNMKCCKINKLPEYTISFTKFYYEARFLQDEGHYEWNVLPFGLKNAPQIFQRRMDQVFRRLTEYCIVYVDDILIYSDTLEDHIKHLEEFIRIVKRHGILLSEKKSEIRNMSLSKNM